MESNSNIIKNLLTKQNCKVKVSSVLDNNAKEFGGNLIIDGSDDTCWCSGQGKTQQVIFDFKNKPTFISDINILIQGGFSPKFIDLYYYSEDPNINKNAEIKLIKRLDIQDINEYQNFKIDLEYKEGISSIKFYCSEFTDFFGRVSIYSISVNGY